MKATYPDEDRPLQHFPELTQRLKAGVEALVARGVPYREAERASDPAVQAWLEQTLAADITITMAAVKQGLLKLPAYEYVGDLEVVDIGLPEDMASFNDLKTEVADEDFIAALLPERRLDAHKGTFGTALIAAGSVNYTGAALLAGEAAYRSGAGLVTMAVPGPVHSALAGRFPEATWVLMPHEVGVIASGGAEVLAKNFERATALLIGPGFGMENATREFIENLVEGKYAGKKTNQRIGFVHRDEQKPVGSDSRLPPMVIDADGLKLLGQIKDWNTKIPAPAIFTPHPGEMALLTGLSKELIQEKRQEIAGQYAQLWGHVVVLKGAFTVVAAPDGRTMVIPIATPALARAGTGDVLAGLIVGLRARDGGQVRVARPGPLRLGRRGAGDGGQHRA